MYCQDDKLQGSGPEIFQKTGDTGTGKFVYLPKIGTSSSLLLPEDAGPDGSSDPVVARN